MDSIHDLGGMQGMGPVPVQADVPFDQLEIWEQRMWGLSRSGLCHGMTIDWFRHVVECMMPADYLTYSYFHKWVTTYMVLLVDSGQITMEELRAGPLANPSGDAPKLTGADILAHNAKMDLSFETDIDSDPVFAVGDSVTTLRHAHSGHSRLPRYARGATGRVIAWHRAHLVPDDGARGAHRGGHLYTVEFPATELWGDEADPRDSVALELWEEYLVQP